MSAEEENELIALKSRLWKLGLGRNNAESTFNKHKDIIPIGSADVAAFLSKYPAMWPLGIGKFYSTVTETKKWMKTSTNVMIFHVQ